MVLRRTGGAVMLASLTTVIGYGSLVIASNQAFVSFGTLAIFGELTCVFAAVVSLPAFLWYLEKRKNKTGHEKADPKSQIQMARENSDPSAHLTTHHREEPLV